VKNESVKNLLCAKANEKTASEIIEAVEHLKEEVNNNTDHVISSLKEQAILDNNSTKEETESIKEFLIQQNSHINTLTDEFNLRIDNSERNILSNFERCFQSLKKDIQELKEEQSRRNISIAPQISVKDEAPHYNNPYHDLPHNLHQNNYQNSPSVAPNSINKSSSNYDQATLNKLLPPIAD
jgi:NurA-like 5'-3' nuclease